VIPALNIDGALPAPQPALNGDGELPAHLPAFNGDGDMAAPLKLVSSMQKQRRRNTSFRNRKYYYIVKSFTSLICECAELIDAIDKESSPTVVELDLMPNDHHEDDVDANATQRNINLLLEDLDDADHMELDKAGRDTNSLPKEHHSVEITATPVGRHTNMPILHSREIRKKKELD